MPNPDHSPPAPKTSPRSRGRKPISFGLLGDDGSIIPVTPKIAHALVKKIGRCQTDSASRHRQANEHRAAERTVQREERESEIAARKRFRFIKTKDPKDGIARQQRSKAQKRSSLRHAPLPHYRAPVVDARGQRGVTFIVYYYNAKKPYGLATVQVEYITNGAALDDDGNALQCSNVGNSVSEVVCAFDHAEQLNRAAQKNAKIVFHIILALDHRLTPDQMMACVRSFCEEALGSRNLPYIAAIHAPPEDGDARNWHAHVVFSHRPMIRTGDHEWSVSPALCTDLDNKAGIKTMREVFASAMTAASFNAGHNQVYTAKSNFDRGLPHEPQVHLGAAKTRLAREGQFVAENERNHDRVLRSELDLVDQKLRQLSEIEAQLQEIVAAADPQAATKRDIFVPVAKAHSPFESLRASPSIDRSNQRNLAKPRHFPIKAPLSPTAHPRLFAQTAQSPFGNLRSVIGPDGKPTANVAKPSVGVIPPPLRPEAQPSVFAQLAQSPFGSLRSVTTPDGDAAIIPARPRHGVITPPLPPTARHAPIIKWALSPFGNLRSAIGADGKPIANVAKPSASAIPPPLRPEAQPTVFAQVAQSPFGNLRSVITPDGDAAIIPARPRHGIITPPLKPTARSVPIMARAVSPFGNLRSAIDPDGKPTVNVAKPPIGAIPPPLRPEAQPMVFAQVAQSPFGNLRSTPAVDGRIPFPANLVKGLHLVPQRVLDNISSLLERADGLRSRISARRKREAELEAEAAVKAAALERQSREKAAAAEAQRRQALSANTSPKIAALNTLATKAQPSNPNIAGPAPKEPRIKMPGNQRAMPVNRKSLLVAGKLFNSQNNPSHDYHWPGPGTIPNAIPNRPYSIDGPSVGPSSSIGTDEQQSHLHNAPATQGGNVTPTVRSTATGHTPPNLTPAQIAAIIAAKGRQV